MSDRKVLNKYFPPDFDPSKVPKGRFGIHRSFKVRLMAPFSMRCNRCGEFIYKGRKFNARKQTVRGEEYLGIEIFRFYINCPSCGGEITFKTDPKNSDYVAELGASRNFESWRDDEKAEEERLYRRKMEDEMDPMKALENIASDSKREIDILDALDEIRTANARRERVDADDAFEALSKTHQAENDDNKDDGKKEEDEDERLARMYFRTEDGAAIKRLLDDPRDGDDDDDNNNNAETNKDDSVFKKPRLPPPKKPAPVKKITAASLGIKKVTKNSDSSASATVSSVSSKPTGGLADYGSDSE